MRAPTYLRAVATRRGLQDPAFHSRNRKPSAFRMASLGMQAITWGKLGVVFGVLAERVLTASLANAARMASASLTQTRKILAEIWD